MTCCCSGEKIFPEGTPPATGGMPKGILGIPIGAAIGT
jgi:hypothetical protein